MATAGNKKDKRRGRASRPRSAGDNSLLFQLGRRVAALCVQAVMTPEQLAKKAGLHRSYLRKLEKGDVNPSALVIAAIAHAMKVSVADLFRSD